MKETFATAAFKTAETYITSNIIQLCVRAVFGALKFQPGPHSKRSIKLEVFANKPPDAKRVFGSTLRIMNSQMLLKLC